MGGEGVERVGGWPVFSEVSGGRALATEEGPLLGRGVQDKVGLACSTSCVPAML